MNRDLDAEIVEKIFNWKPFQVGPDADGENACEILTEDGKLPDGYQLPGKGLLGRGFMAPRFSIDWIEALKLAKHIKMPLDVSEIDFNDWQFPEKLSRRCLDFWKNKNKND